MMQVRCTTSSPVLLLLDNHDSHLSFDVLDYAKDHGIVMLSFPPHCSHHMQPLDRTVYGPFKKHYNSALREWMVDNPGKPAGIYNTRIKSRRLGLETVSRPDFERLGLVSVSGKSGKVSSRLEQNFKHLGLVSVSSTKVSFTS